MMKNIAAKTKVLHYQKTYKSEDAFITKIAAKLSAFVENISIEQHG